MPKPPELLTVIKGQPTSAEIRSELAAEGRPVLVAFSGGKDSIAATIALKEAGITPRLVYLYGVPGRAPGRTLEFVESSLARLEDELELPIARYPHPSLYRLINGAIYQPPERLATILAAQLPNIDYEDLWGWIREDLELPADTWIADGVRAADSIMRRASLTKHGLRKYRTHKVSVIGDWRKAAVMGSLERAGVTLPPEYAHFNRSFDGIDYRFVAPIREHYPRDYELIQFWFPMIELAFLRVQMAAEHKTGAPADGEA